MHIYLFLLNHYVISCASFTKLYFKLYYEAIVIKQHGSDMKVPLLLHSITRQVIYSTIHICRDVLPHWMPDSKLSNSHKPKPPKLWGKINFILKIKLPKQGAIEIRKCKEDNPKCWERRSKVWGNNIFKMLLLSCS